MSDDRLDQQTERAFAQMERDLPRVAPGPDLYANILAALPRPMADAAPVALPVARRRAWRWRPRIALPATAALVALVAALVIALAVTGGPAPSVSAALVAHAGSGAHGKVELYDPTTNDGRLVLSLKGLRRAPAGEHYTVWVLRSGIAEMTPVASLAAGEDVRLDLPLPSRGRYSAVDISLQRDDASPVHSANSVAGATLG